MARKKQGKKMVLADRVPPFSQIAATPIGSGALVFGLDDNGRVWATHAHRSDAGDDGEWARLHTFRKT